MSKKPPSPPPLSPHGAEVDPVPVRVCSRSLTWPRRPGDPHCGKEAFLHVAWMIDEEGVEPGFVCTDHAAELDRNGWIPEQQHEVGGDCGMPGSLWFTNADGSSYCNVPDDQPEAGEAFAAVHAEVSS